MNQKIMLKAKRIFTNNIKPPYDKQIIDMQLICNGFTNQSFKVTNAQKQSFQVRLGNEKINRNNERLILDLLDNHGDFIYYNPKSGNAIRKWAEGHNPTIDECRLDQFLKAFSIELQKIHNLKVDNKITKRDFFIFESISDFTGLEDQLEEYRTIIKKYADYELVISHNDLRPENLIWNKKNLVVIDYEWGTLNNRYWDLANFLREIKYPIKDLESMLSNHFPWADCQIIQEFLFASTFFAYQWTFFPEPTKEILAYREDAKKLMTSYFKLIKK